jgi:RNA polymerase sigma factor (TIGR02999 family)
MNAMSNIKDTATRLLMDWGEGDSAALDRLMPIIYGELQEIARKSLFRERNDHTLTTTALVHEAYLNLVNQKRVRWQNKSHFFAIAAQSMRRILIDYARRRNAGKRWGKKNSITLNEELIAGSIDNEDLLTLDESLTRLENLDERLARIVEYRFFAGLSIDETAEVLSISPATVKRDWRTAKAWLLHDMQAAE